jgi:hypothetical protein
MEPSTAETAELLKTRLKVLSVQLCAGTLSWAEYQRMAREVWIEINGDSWSELKKL